MIASFSYQNRSFRADLSRPIDLSIGIQNGPSASCFWAPEADFSPVRAGDFVGSVAEGGPVNFFNVRFNPHGNGTHTECLSHISDLGFRLSECLDRSHFLAQVVSVFPEKTDDGDRVIFKKHLENWVKKGQAEAIIVRTLPNFESKKKQNWSGSNPPYFHHEALSFLAEMGFEHFLTDLPSVDREEDGGKLLAHRAWWGFGGALRQKSTITELVFVPDSVADGLFLLELQTANFALDATPSRPVIFEITN